LNANPAIVAARGTNYGMRSATWISRFTDMTRQVAAHRDRRVLLAGDAAHVHSPVGGQGLKTGIQDAVNPGWKLAQVVNATSPETLLDTYHAERHPVAARVLRNTMAQTALIGPGERIAALRDTMSELLSMDESPNWATRPSSCAADVIATATSLADAFWHIATPGPDAAALYRSDPRLAHAIVDIRPRLTRILTALLDGMTAATRLD
jgi:FAD binding domain/Tetracyclin repressor-like, C-terminal domain